MNKKSDVLKGLELTGILQKAKVSKFLTSYQSNDGSFVENFHQGHEEILEAKGRVEVMVVNLKGFNLMVTELGLDTPDEFHPFAGLYAGTPIICITNHPFTFEVCGTI